MCQPFPEIVTTPQNKHFLVVFYNLCNILHNFIVVFLLDFKENIISLQTEN